MDKEIIEILRNIQTEIEFISYGGRQAFMVEHEGEWWYGVKCYACEDISFISHMNTFYDIKYYKCGKCIAQDIKDEEIFGKMHCLECDNKVICGEEEDWEDQCSWYCDDCLKLPTIIKKLEEYKIDQQKTNEEYAKKVKTYS